MSALKFYDQAIQMCGLGGDLTCSAKVTDGETSAIHKIIEGLKEDVRVKMPQYMRRK